MPQADLDAAEDALVALHLERQVLEDELEALRAEAEYLLAFAGKEPLSFHYSRRRFLLRLEEELARSERHEGARFSVMCLEVGRAAPRSFAPMLAGIVRQGDVVARTSASAWMILLHAAGILGRRRFEMRLLDQLAQIEAREQLPKTRVTSATYPRDGNTADALIRATIGGLTSGLPTPMPPRGLDDPLASMAPPGGHRDEERDVENAIREALDTGLTGEIVVRGARTVGRIYTVNGRIGWAHFGGRASSFTEHIVRDRGASLSAVRAVFLACKRNGRSFIEALVEAGIVQRDDMRRLLRMHLGSHVAGILGLDDAEVIVVPQHRTFTSGLAFTLDELLYF